METIKLHIQAGTIWYIMFIVSIVLHEATHAYVSSAFGDLTASNKGLLTLNPIPHIKREIIGMVVVPLISYVLFEFVIGWASIPFNVAWAKKNTKRFSFMMLSGPLANFVLLIIFSIVILVGIHHGVFHKPKIMVYSIIFYSSYPLTIILALSIGFSINLIILFLNILPLPTLDGAAFFLLFVKNEKAKQLFDKLYDRRSYWVSITISALIYLKFFDKVHHILVNLLFNI